VTDAVVDPGHGDRVQCAGSTWNCAVGLAGTLEKDLTLDVARRVTSRLTALGLAAVLTRDDDINPSLRDRAVFAAGDGVRTFVSLHFNAAPDPRVQATEIWIHEAAGEASRAFAGAIGAAVAAVTGHPLAPIAAAPMAVLDPSYHAADTAACLVEISYLSDPEEEARLSDPDYRQRIADAIAGAIAENAGVVVEVQASFEVYHTVPLVEQLTGMSCWAAAAAMLVGWRDCIDIRAEEVARGSGRFEAYRDGLEPRDVDSLARSFNLIAEPAHTITVADLRRLLECHGPLWVGEASPGLHVVVVVGMSGDGTPDGTWVRVNDPWPVGRGERYSIRFSELASNLRAVAGIAGFRAQVLHTGGRR
jgi:N-acetylmuramoyl-L-alanine amidase